MKVPPEAEPGQPLQGPSRPAAAATSLAVLLIAIATLTPAPDDPPNRCGFLAFWCGYTPAVDVALNVVLFGPLGLALARLGLRAIQSAGTATAVSLVVELLQRFIITGRDSSIRDVVANGLGGALGWWLATAWPRLVRPSPRQAARFASGWAAVVTASMVFGGLLLRAYLPKAAWFGQRAAEMSNYATFEGELLTAALSGGPMPSHQLDEHSGFRERVERLGPAIAARVVTSRERPDRPAPIGSVFDEHRRKVLLLAQQHRDLVFEPYLVGDHLGFQAIGLRLPRAFSGTAGDTLVVAGALVHGRLVALAKESGSPNAAVAEQALGPIDAWRLVLPGTWRLSPNVAGVAGFGWLLLLFYPLGFWSRTARPVRPAAWRAWTVGVPAAIALLPIPFGLPIARWSGWVAVGLAVLLGGILAKTRTDAEVSRNGA